MKTNKILLGGFAGGVTFFLLGWLIYGILLNGYMTASLNQCAARPMQDMVMWAMFLSNLTLGMLLALVFNWSGISGITNSAKIAAIIGLLIFLSMDLGNFAMSNMYNNSSVMIIDVLVSTIMMTVTGVVVALVMGKREA